MIIGNVVDDREQKLSLQVEGAELLGFGSANPKTQYGYLARETETFRGRAQIILKKIDDMAIFVSVTGESGLYAELTIKD